MNLNYNYLPKSNLSEFVEVCTSPCSACKKKCCEKYKKKGKHCKKCPKL